MKILEELWYGNITPQRAGHETRQPIAQAGSPHYPT